MQPPSSARRSAGKRSRVRRYGLLLVLALLTASVSVLFADEVVRMLARESIVFAHELPAGAQLRVSDRLVRILGVGAPGEAVAVTVGNTILVSTRFARLPNHRQQRILSHEAIHVQQRQRLGRSYLFVYAMQYVRYGYSAHPLEREARMRS